MPLSNPNPHTRRLDLTRTRAVANRFISKLTDSPLVTIIAVFGIITLIGDIFSTLSGWWYACYILLILGYFTEKVLDRQVATYNTKAETKPVDNE